MIVCSIAHYSTELLSRGQRQTLIQPLPQCQRESIDEPTDSENSPMLMYSELPASRDSQAIVPTIHDCLNGRGLHNLHVKNTSIILSACWSWGSDRFRPERRSKTGRFAFEGLCFECLRASSFCLCGSLQPSFRHCNGLRGSGVSVGCWTWWCTVGRFRWPGCAIVDGLPGLCGSSSVSRW